MSRNHPTATATAAVTAAAGTGTAAATATATAADQLIKILINIIISSEKGN